MLLIKYIMNKIRSNDFENNTYPNSFNLMSETYSVKNNLDFFFCVYYLRIFQKTNASNLFIKQKEQIGVFILKQKVLSSII